MDRWLLFCHEEKSVHTGLSSENILCKKAVTLHCICFHKEECKKNAKYAMQKIAMEKMGRTWKRPTRLLFQSLPVGSTNRGGRRKCSPQSGLAFFSGCEPEAQRKVTMPCSGVRQKKKRKRKIKTKNAPPAVKVTAPGLEWACDTGNADINSAFWVLGAWSGVKYLAIYWWNWNEEGGQKLGSLFPGGNCSPPMLQWVHRHSRNVHPSKVIFCFEFCAQNFPHPTFWLELPDNNRTFIDSGGGSSSNAELLICSVK